MKHIPLGRRRPSRLGDALRRDLIEDARRMTPEERLQCALRLTRAAWRIHLAGRSARASDPPPRP
ncbi:MAG TPA: hypothetical protein VNO22_06405 [Planctomycetota bacterium]|nr:hypothetical protein [Planctomycetota bacterium]